YDELIALLDSYYQTGDFHPGTANKLFHDTPWPEGGQDDWRFDTTGIEYYHIYAQQAEDNTIVGMKAKSIPIIQPLSVPPLSIITYFDPVPGKGDGTVPVLSAARMGTVDGINYDLNAPDALVYSFVNTNPDDDENYDHNGMTGNPDIQDLVLRILRNSVPPES